MLRRECGNEVGARATNLLVLRRECGNKPGDSFKGNYRGWFMRVIPSFAENQQGKQPVVSLLSPRDPRLNNQVPGALLPFLFWLGGFPY